MSIYTYQDLQADLKNHAKDKHDENVAKWLQSRPEVGALNSGKFYIYAGANRVYTEIEVFS